MRNNRALFVLTGHDRLGPANSEAEKTGFHLSEAAVPWHILNTVGAKVDFATPKGGSAPIDPGSLDREDAINCKFLEADNVKAALENAPALANVDLSHYDALYFPGGHGTMWDLPESNAVADAVREMWQSGKLIAAVCHGPAALVNVKLDDGSWLVNGKRVSAFTDAEERAVEKDSVVPFLLAAKLASRGATLVAADNFESSVSVDGRLITGQNPASAKPLGEAIVDKLASASRDAA